MYHDVPWKRGGGYERWCYIRGAHGAIDCERIAVQAERGALGDGQGGGGEDDGDKNKIQRAGSAT